MKQNLQIRTMLCTISAAFFLVSYASAAGEIYVNDGTETLPSSIQEAYGIGGSGDTAQIGTDAPYAITGNGLAPVVTPAPTPAPTPVPTTPPTTPELPAGQDGQIVHIGLAYNTTALPSANLENAVGSGYLFGFYDSNRDFYSIGWTAERTLTMVKDTNVSVSGGTIGCYHIKLSNTYASFAEAEQAAKSYPDAFPAFYHGTYSVLVGQYQTMDAANAALQARGIQGTGFTASNKCVVVTKTGTTQILFEFDYGDMFSLAVRPVSTGAKAQTWHKGFKYYGDFQFCRLNGGDMTVSNLLPLEDYIKGVVPYEMSASWPVEALKAQALCARTYVLSNLKKHRNYGFDVCNSTDCQAYRGTGSANAHTDQSVDLTKGKIIRYNGQLCSTLYSSSDGGATEDSENVFVSALPYLRGKKDPYEASIDFPNKSWSVSYSNTDILSKLTKKGYNLSTIVSIVPEYTRMGNMNKLTFTDVNGKSVTISKDQCRTVMGLNSIHYTMTQRAGTNMYDISGGGWGHNVGMSQWGAYSMAKVHSKTGEDIIKFYYTGVSIT